MFSGSITALVTPFKNGKVDLKAFERFIGFQLERGTDGLVPCGTTGEAPTLTLTEYRQVVAAAVSAAGQRVPVIAGAGSNDTARAVELGKAAKKAGADAVLVVTPYYNKPSQEGMFLHYSRVAREVRLPVVLYNVPGRTGVNLAPETVARLASAHANIVALKESGNVEQVGQVLSLCGITVLSGDDPTVLPAMALGARGVVSVLSNLMPREVHDLVQAALEGRWKDARRLNDRLHPLGKALVSLEGNPTPVKAALALCGIVPGGEVRLPLAPIGPESRRQLLEVLKRTGLPPRKSSGAT